MVSAGAAFPRINHFVVNRARRKDHFTRLTLLGVTELAPCGRTRIAERRRLGFEGVFLPLDFLFFVLGHATPIHRATIPS